MNEEEQVHEAVSLKKKSTGDSGKSSRMVQVSALPAGCVLRMGTGELMCRLFKGCQASLCLLEIASTSEYHGSKMILTTEKKKNRH